MPKRKGRGRGPARGRLKTLSGEKFHESGNLDIPVNPSKMLEVDGGSGFEEEHEADTSTKPKRKRVGEPRGSTVLNKFQENADGNLAVPANPLNVAEVGTARWEDSELREAGAGNASKGKGRLRPSGSMVQKFQENADGKLDALISNIVGEVIGRLEQEAGNTPMRKGRGRPKGSTSLKKFQRSADGNMDILNNPSNLVEIGTGFEEEQQADTGATLKKKGRGRPKGSMGKKKCQETADGNSGIFNNLSNLREVGHSAEEEQEAVTIPMPMGRGRGRPKGSTTGQTHRQNADLYILPKKKGRGRTRGLRVQMKRQRSADGKLDVLIHPVKMVAVGPGRKDFITDLSVIVRQNARHNVYKWKQVPQSVRDTIVQKILDNWRLPDTVLVRKAILDEAGRLYRNWRNRLHNYYLTFETKEEALKHVPDDINASDWPILVDYFSSPVFETMSAKNKANKAKQMVNHACGPKSFQAVSYDARDIVTGKEPDLHTLWQLTHKRANGEWVDEASKEIHDKVAQQIVEKLDELEDYGDEIARMEPEIIESAFKSLVGKKSYMQGIAAGSSIRVQVKQLQAELEAQKRETEESRITCNELRAKLVEVESQLVEECRKREEAEVRLLDRQREMNEINSQVQTAIQAALSQQKLLTTEADSSSRQHRKITELEAQLHEAEDVITELRGELRRFGMR